MDSMNAASPSECMAVLCVSPAGLYNGFVIKQELGVTRSLEPRRRCVSESSISSNSSAHSTAR